VVQLPSGTVTFLFSDIEGSTQLWERHPDAMKNALSRHDAILRSAIDEHGGVLLKTAGDGALAVFATAVDAISAAVATQQLLCREPWEATGPLLVRIGVHTGEAEERGGDYFGPAVNRAARLMALAHGGQVVLSRATEAVLRDGLPEEIDLLDLGEYHLVGMARAERVFQVAHTDLRRDFPGLRSVDRTPGNLPSEVTSFIGRDQVSERVAMTLDQARVVTLTGVGGVGKTRLAFHVAGMDAVAARYRDGCWCCELAPVREPDAVPEAIATALGVEPRQGVTATESLLDFLRSKSLLLVLDNCEHLLQPVGDVVSQIEQLCPRVEILATSREGLGVAGEWIVAVGSLDVAGSDASLDTLRSCEAVRLFADRARAVKADFAVDATNAEAVAQVCHRLDGIALAIELAAARVAALSPIELSRRLDQRFRILGGGSRATVERHQTLRAAVDWSYEMLGENEQIVFDRLSVFAGGFPLAGAEAVTSGEGIEEHDVFDILAALVARSLVVAQTNAAETRYTQYETLRQYAQEQLDQRGETEGIRSRHAGFFASFVERVARRHDEAPSEFEWDEELEREVDNLRVAFAWAVDSQDCEAALRLLANVNMPSMSAVVLAFRPIADIAIELPGASENPAFPDALAAAAWYAHQRNDTDLARSRCDEAVAAAQRLGVAIAPKTWTIRSFIAMSSGDLDEHFECTSRAADLYRALGDTAGLAISLGQRAVGSTLRSNTVAAERDAEEALALLPHIDALGAKVPVLSLGAFGLANSDPERALLLINEAIEINERLGRRAGLLSATAGHIAFRLGRRDDALRLSIGAIDDARQVGAWPIVAPMLKRVGDLLAAEDPETAAVLHGAGQGGIPSPHLDDEHAKAVAGIDTALGEARRLELNARGEAMNQEDAVALAITAVESIAGTSPRTTQDRPGE
jgi:predicted ATPase/class 3 adenylate cyclase